MKNRVTFKILFACAFIFLTDCRFEDGPVISFNGVYERLSGTWKLSSYQVDGLELITYLNNLFGSSCDFEFPSNWTPKCDCGIPTWNITWGDTMSNFYIASPQLDNINKDNLNFYYGPVHSNVQFNFPKLNPLSAPYISWKITKLTMDDLWFEVEDASHHYRMKLQR